jgi:hypothetical protein
MTAPLLIRNAAWAVVWDAPARRHAYARGMDVLLEGGRVVAIARHDPDAPVPPGTEVVDGSGVRQGGRAPQIVDNGRDPDLRAGLVLAEPAHPPQA